MVIPGSLLDELGASYALDDVHIENLRRNGFVHLKGVFSQDLLAFFREPLARIVAAESQQLPPLAERDAYGRAFAQIMNVWTRHEHVRDFILNRKTAEIATRLLRCSGVRMWHDQ
ncbi:MAG: phytanoyl-CoA dioxygenase, partial [Halioglobus sp.]|nr:phytanoyl-CoA dioxygenase [Halioglobus sp.]